MHKSFHTRFKIKNHKTGFRKKVTNHNTLNFVEVNAFFYGSNFGSCQKHQLKDYHPAVERGIIIVIFYKKKSIFYR